LSEDGWCSGREDKPNLAGAYLNFDLAYPSDAIPNDFFPSDEATYGYKDFGVWNITYESISCLPNWSGARNAAALGSVANLGTGACCPVNPTGDPNNTCPSFSDQTGLPPDTTTSGCFRPLPAAGSLSLGLVLFHVAISFLISIV